MTQGIVLFTDGGCRPNPGPGGWGMHGYLYSTETPKKGSGNSDHILTDKGYATKAAAAIAANAVSMTPEALAAYKKDTGKNFRVPSMAEVTPIHYIDGFGAVGFDITNNVAELVAAISGLKYAADYDVQAVQIVTDSEYVRKGLEGWVEGWSRNGWVKSDGSEIANVKHWKDLVAARDVLTARGATVRIAWIRGHDDHLGNVLADKLATIAVMKARGGELVTVINSTKAEGYWGYTPDRHPFLYNRRMYFNTLLDFNTAGEYYLGEHGKDDDLLGKRISDGAYAVVKLEAPDPILEMLRTHQCLLAGNTDNLIMARLDHLYRADTHRELSTYGTAAIEQAAQYRLDLLCLDREPLTRELRPPKLAMRAVESVSELSEKLTKYLEKDPSICVTDLTPILYETTLKVPKKGESTTIMKLKPEYNVGFAALEVDANYKCTDESASASVILTLGIDLLDRNALKRLETYNPKVTLISWSESPFTFRYATVVEAGNDKGIWAGVYSNLRIVT